MTSNGGSFRSRGQKKTAVTLKCGESHDEQLLLLPTGTSVRECVATSKLVSGVQHEVARKHWWDQQVSKLSVKLLECKRDGT